MFQHKLQRAMVKPILHFGCKPNPTPGIFLSFSLWYLVEKKGGKDRERVPLKKSEQHCFEQELAVEQ